jgi:soluble lytic murein transglycosylase
MKDFLRQRKVWLTLAASAGGLALLAGALLPIEKLIEGSQPGGIGSLASFKPKAESVGAPGAVISPLVAQSLAQRADSLKQAAQKLRPSLERNRARYLLASDLLTQGQEEKALEQLKGLEKDYAVLAPQVLLKRAQAFEAVGQQKEATATLQALVERHPKEPATAEALYTLGRQNPKYWDQALAKFPAHPRTVEIAKTRLKKNPKQLPLLLTVAKYGVNSEGYTEVLDRLTSPQFANKLKPQDWEAIGFGYWENQAYDKAAIAYARAPQTPLNVYRSGRGLHLTSRPGAEERYRQTVRKFPKSEEAKLALSRLAGLARDPKMQLAYLDQMIKDYPDRAADAIAQKSKLFDKMKSEKTAAQLRQILLTNYAKSDAAAEMRWEYARDRAKVGDFKLAKQWSEPILTNNSDSDIAAEAGFWTGKWAQRLDQQDQAAKIFQNVLSQYPESYYAWRSASMLGWNVGDFNSVRALNPQVQKPAARPELPVGSPALKELYQLGQEQDAWAYWQTEFRNRTNPTVSEQFTDGVMRLGVGDNLDGIFMVGSLRDRNDPDDQSQYQNLRQQDAYWQALYPFPYVDQIESWSQQRQLNPMLVTALIRQESRFESKIKSSAGAVGLMQVMPDTATYIAKNIKLKGFKLDDPETNIKLGTWYLDYTHAKYSNNTMLAVASYNAGPGAVSGWLSKSKTQDPDEFIESIPYDETRGYVKSVLGNYWNYLRLYNPEISQRLARITGNRSTN